MSARGRVLQLAIAAVFLGSCASGGGIGVLVPSTVSSKDNRPGALFKDVFNGFWCADTMVIVMPTEDWATKDVYQRAIDFWSEQVPKIRFVLRDAYDERDRAYTIPIYRGEYNREQERLCYIHDDCWGGEFLKGDTTPSNKEKGGPCFSGSTILLFNIFYAQSADEQAKLFAHEMGHALGLRHHDGVNLMNHGFGREFMLDKRQKMALWAAYGKKKS